MGRVLPILFNTDMVRAILDGRKTITRRAVRFKYDNTEMKMRTDKYGTRLIEIQKDIEGETHGKNPGGGTWHKLLPYIEKSPPYKKGDVLYVRETWCKGELNYHEERYFYKADDNDFPCCWHPSIRMPKEAARIWLKVTDVRVERLQDMKEAYSEGIHFCDCPDGYTWKSYTDMHNCYTEPMAAMKALWNSTVKKAELDKYGWKANPWVWVIEFEWCEKPEVN